MSEGTDQPANEASFQQQMTESAREIVRTDSPPYEAGIALWSVMLRDVGTENAAEFTHRAWHMWGFLTDGLDGPAPYRRGLSELEVEDLMRQAAGEWLDLPKNRDAIARYFDRWDDWPDSIRAEP